MKESGRPRILLLADYSNFHNTLAKGLRRLGCDVTVISDGTTFMQTDRDIDISRSDSRFGGLILMLKLLGPLHRHLRGYDIVSLRNPNFIELRPERTAGIFRRLRRDNPNIFLTALTTDSIFLDMLEAKDSPLAYSEWLIRGEPAPLMIHDREQWESWHSRAMTTLDNLVYDNIDGAVSALYEYQLALQMRLPADRSAYGGIPIETRDIEFRPMETPSRIRIFLGRDRRRKLIKGTDLLEQAALDVCSRHPEKAELRIIENVSYKEFHEEMRHSHLVLDQIYSYTPATTALEAMAMGINTMSGGEKEYYDFIAERELHPVINAPYDYDTLRAELERVILHPEEFPRRSREGRVFVERHNDTDIVARRFLNFWLSRLEAKGYRIPSRDN
ncbi:MAG: hypothetical protein K2F64_03440 [Muribaculaceae bacterium]|nr:hypothetical protein [Muribaculaceae bacterium]